MPTPTPHPTPPPPRREARAGLVVAGAIVALVAAALIAAGALALWSDGRADADGFLSTDDHALATAAPALVSANLDLDLDGAGWLLEGGDAGTLRLTAADTAGEPVFVGIARTSDAEDYLDGVARTTVDDLDWGPFHSGPDRHDTPGGLVAAPPRAAPIWAASTEGPGEQALTWDVRDGDWSVVVMNADGSPQVDVELTAGARVPWLGEIGWSAIGAGLLVAVAAGALLLAGLRRPRLRRPAPAPRPSGATA